MLIYRDYSLQLITNNFIQNTPWCRDMRRWFTPDQTAGIWFAKEDYDKYRKMALDFRVPAGRIYHVDKSLLPGYSGYVPGKYKQKGQVGRQSSP